MNNIKFLIESLENEGNSITKLSKIFDTYEYLLKIITLNQLHSLVGDINNIDPKEKSYINICNLFISNFQRPSFGHWISLLRDIIKLNKSNDLGKILKGADEVVSKRNNFAHGITPEVDKASKVNNHLMPILYDLYQFIDDNGIYEKTINKLELTPLSWTIDEIFNGIKKSKLVYLNYSNGLFNERDLYDRFMTFYDDYFNIKINVSDEQVLLLLDDYFPREYWENNIAKEAEENNLIFLYGYPGVGKTLLSARVSQMLNCHMYRFASTDKDLNNVKKAFVYLYESMRLKIGGVAKIVDSIPDNELYKRLLRLIDYSKNCGDTQYFIFDGLDELEDAQFGLFCDFLKLFYKTNIHIIVSSRNKNLSNTILRDIKNMKFIELESLTQLEVKEWIRNKSDKINYPSKEFIERIYNYSGGNFLFLSNIPKNLDEFEYIELTKNVPEGIEQIFKDITNQFANDIDILLTMVIIPGVVSKELLMKLFDINLSRLESIMHYLKIVVKEVKSGDYMLFHDKFYEFLQKRYRTELYNLAYDVLEKVDSLKLLIKSYNSIIDIFSSVDDYDGLLIWIENEIKYTENHSMFNINRYEYITTIQKGFDLIMSQNFYYYGRCLPILDIFISKNFQLLFDWKVSIDISKNVDLFLLYIDINKYQNINLMYACNMHIVQDIKKNGHDYITTLEYLQTVNLSIDYNSLNKLRCLDYIGLTYSKLGDQFPKEKSYYKYKAIEKFSELIEIGKNDPSNIWIGYAKMNRGKSRNDYSLNEKEEALKDITDAVIIRENVAYCDNILKKNISDIGNKIQALLTLSMGYENLLIFYSTKIQGANDTEKYAFKLYESVKFALELSKNQTQEFYFTCRVLVTLCEYYISLNRMNECREVYEILKDVYIPENRVERFHAIQSHFTSIESSIIKLNELILKLKKIKAKRYQAEKKNNEEHYDTLCNEAKTLKQEILQDHNLLYQFLQKFSLIKIKFKNSDILDLIEH